MIYAHEIIFQQNLNKIHIYARSDKKSFFFFFFCFLHNVDYKDNFQATIVDLIRLKKISQVRILTNFNIFLESVGYDCEPVRGCSSKFTKSIDIWCSKNHIESDLLYEFISIYIGHYVFTIVHNTWESPQNKIWSVNEIVGDLENDFSSSLNRFLYLFQMENQNIYFLKYYLILNYIWVFPFFCLISSNKVEVLHYTIRDCNGGTGVGKVLPYGWYLKCNEVWLLKTKKALYGGLSPTITPKQIVFNGDAYVYDVICNSKYNYPIWLTNNILIGSADQYASGFLNTSVYKINDILDTLNYLNSTKMQFNLPLIQFFRNFFQSEDSYIRVFQNNLNRINEFKAILMEIEFITKITSDFFFFHVLDSRYRIYVKNFPLNYQLSKFCRHVLTFQINGYRTVFIYRKFLIDFKIEALMQKSKIFISQSVDSDILKTIYNFFNISLPLLNDYSTIESNLSIFIFAEALYNVLYRLGRESGLDIKKSLLRGCEVLKIIQTGDIEVNEFRTKKFIEAASLIYNIKHWNFSNLKLPTLSWYSDASANVIQLLIFKLFILNEKTLEICNIYNNNTEYKDIYDFVAKRIIAKGGSHVGLITRELIKIRVMPGVYGQTFFRFIRESELLLANNLEWRKLEIVEKRKFLTFLDNEIWTILEENGIELKEFLILCKSLITPTTIENARWFNKLEMPVIIEKKKNLRTELRASLKKARFSNNTVRASALQKKIKELETSDLRKHIHFIFRKEKKTIKIRLQRAQYQLDLFSLRNSIAASSNHSDDAYILHLTIQKIKKLEIPITVIHDSIGSPIEFAAIVKILFKLSNIDFLEKLLICDEFPFNLLKIKHSKKDIETLRKNFMQKRDYRLTLMAQNKTSFIEKLLSSTNFFN